jgi:hypothetical protein
MASRILQTIEADNGKGECKISLVDEHFEIDYYDDNGRRFFNEEYFKHTRGDVTNIAMDWADGTTHLEDNK